MHYACVQAQSVLDVRVLFVAHTHHPLRAEHVLLTHLVLTIGGPELIGLLCHTTRPTFRRESHNPAFPPPSSLPGSEDQWARPPVVRPLPSPLPIARVASKAPCVLFWYIVGAG